MVAMSKVAKAVLVRTNIRFVEEVYPSLMKKFMAEFSISREEILQVYHQYEGHGEMRAFSEALKNGRF